jgi:dihydrofolate reductase
MRKIVAEMFVSLDGVVEGSDKWSFDYVDEELGQELGALMADRGGILLGRRTYQIMAPYWPGRGTDDPIAAGMNNLPKYVVSTTLETVAEWENSTLLKGDPVAELNKLKQQPGKKIAIIGSATLIRSLLKQEVIDELVLLVYPIVAGTGKRLFEDYNDKLPLNLIQSRTFDSGVVKLVYAPTAQPT